MNKTMILINLVLFVCVGAVRVPTTWPQHPSTATRQYNNNNNNNRMNGWHDDPKRRYTILPYFPATGVRNNESKDQYLGQRKPTNKKIAKTRRKTQPKIISQPQRTLTASIRFGKNIQPSPYRVQIEPYPKITNIENHFVHPKFNPPKEFERNFQPIAKDNNADPTYFSDVPTRPIYPGAGVWAQPGSKHQPYIRPQTTTTTTQASVEEDSDGYEIFKAAKKEFHKDKNKHKQNLSGIAKQNRLKHEDSSKASSDNHRENNEEEEEFVPQRTYSQVRKYEDEEHFPADLKEPSLREIIKDSKVHTVYTEEGYEDSSYDHGDEEKNGENEEKANHSTAQDSITAGSNYGDNKYAQTEILKTTAVKENSTGGMEYEISSQMKIKLGPKRKPKLAYSKKMSGNIDFAQLPKENSSKPAIDAETAQSIMSDISAHFINSKTRRKRDAKYPYYDTKDINKMSPMRYAENMKNIPIKTQGKMAFYEQASEKVKCEEVPNNLNPVPKQIEDGKNASHSDGDKKSRLINLGDKIDCFKLRYFGDNPFDSPFFSEDLIENPEPIFKELGKSEASNIDKALYEIAKIQEDKIDLKSSTITEEKKPITLKPVIFDDSDLYQNKEHEELIENIGESEDVSITTYEPDYEDVTTEITPEAGKINENILKNFNSKRQAKVSDLIFDIQNNSTDYDYEDDLDVNKNSTLNETEALPDALALRMKRRRRRKRPHYPIRMKMSKYVPKYHHQHVPVVYNQIYPSSTVSPRYNTISEVFYKDEIKPNEQLNVFADIINNIKNSTRDAATSASEQQTALKLPATKTRPAVRKYKKPISYEQPIVYTEAYTKRPNRKKRLPFNDQIYEEYMNTLKQNVPESHDAKIEEFFKITNAPIQKKKRKHIPKIDYLEDGNVGTVNPDYEPYPANANIMSTYTTIDIPINKYYVPGMKPPPAYEKPYIYSDFQLLTTNLLRRRNDYANHRMKRSPARLAYSEIRRQPSRQKPEVVEDEPIEEEEDDDYVPHRPTNFHYDPETDKIIYDKKPDQNPTPIEYEEVEEEEEEVVTKAPAKTTTHRTVYHKDVHNKSNGLTIVDFLAKLKTDPSYKIISDPEPKDTKTTTTTISPANKKTTPPEFLSFLEKLHKTDGYKKIEFEDETVKKKKPAAATTTTTTTEAATEETEKEEEPLSNVQNSPGGQFNSGGGFQLFDISEYLPKTKNYSPRTSIDYSKYKTIERTTSRHNLSSRYSEDEELPLERMGTQRPLNEATIVEEESKFSEEEIVSTKRPTTTTTTTTTTKKPEIITTTRVRIRNRKRPTTTRRPLTTTTSTITEQEEAQAKPATHRPATRVYPRRQRPKIRLRPTTTAPTPIENPEQDSTPKIRRAQRKLSDTLIISIPTNHKPRYTPIDRIDVNPIYLASHKQPRLVTPDIINFNNTRVSTTKPDNHINPRKLDVEVFNKNYDKTKKHGGNYISETDKASSERLSDIVVNPSDYYSDPILPATINQLSQEADDRSMDYDYDDEVKIYFDGGEKRKTGIIKDPSKRLYFYAPV